MYSFEECLGIMRPYSLISDDRLRVIYDIMKGCKAPLYRTAELGVYRGGSSILMTLAGGRGHLAFDTFTGIPNIGPEDLTGTDRHFVNDFSLCHTAANSEKFEVLHRLRNWYIQPVVGLFPDSSKPFETCMFSVVHFDGDTYQSCVDFIEFFGPRMMAGGAMIFDDYGWHKCPGVKLAVDAVYGGRVEVIVPNQCVVRF